MRIAALAIFFAANIYVSQASASDGVLTVIQDDPDPVIFLTGYSAGRHTKVHLIRSRAESEGATARLDEQNKLHSAMKTLFQRGAATDEELRASMYQQKIAVAELEKADSRVHRYEAMEAVLNLDLNYSSGEAITIEDLYAGHRRSWEAECAEVTASVKEWQAKIDFWNYISSVSEHLIKRKYRGILDGVHCKTELAVARAEHKARQQIEALCMQNLPTIEMLRDMVKRKLESKQASHIYFERP
jgi:hypothetical protein